MFASGKAKRKNSSVIIERTRRITGNFYLQTQAQADWLATLLADRSKQMIPFFSIKNAPALPWLELGDIVQFTDDGGSLTTAQNAIIVGIQTKFDQTEFTQSFNLSLLDYWVDDSVDYYIIGETLLGSGACYY